MRPPLWFIAAIVSLPAALWATSTASATCSGVTTSGTTSASCSGASAGASGGYAFAEVFPTTPLGSFGAGASSTETLTVNFNGWWPTAIGQIFWRPVISASAFGTGQAGGHVSGPAGSIGISAPPGGSTLAYSGGFPVLFGVEQAVTLTMHASATGFDRQSGSAWSRFEGFILVDSTGAIGTLVPTPEPATFLLAGAALTAFAFLKRR